MAFQFAIAGSCVRKQKILSPTPNMLLNLIVQITIHVNHIQFPFDRCVFVWQSQLNDSAAFAILFGCSLFRMFVALFCFIQRAPDF